jgi:hypothetical protein
MVSRFRELCDELNNTLTPALRSAGYTGSNEEFSRQAVRYEFKRAGPSGKETIAIQKLRLGGASNGVPSTWSRTRSGILAGTYVTPKPAIVSLRP